MTLSVFAQMIGEGIAIASLPLHLTKLGAKPVEVGLATSAFSLAQMVCCPILVRSSGRVGRGRVLRWCLAGATLSNVGIACSPSVRKSWAQRKSLPIRSKSSPSYGWPSVLAQNSTSSPARPTNRSSLGLAGAKQMS